MLTCSVLIAEDEPLVARFIGQVIEKIEGLQVLEKARSRRAPGSDYNSSDDKRSPAVTRRPRFTRLSFSPLGKSTCLKRIQRPRKEG